jgi:hypothetical protein
LLRFGEPAIEGDILPESRTAKDTKQVAIIGFSFALDAAR